MMGVGSELNSVNGLEALFFPLSSGILDSIPDGETTAQLMYGVNPALLHRAQSYTAIQMDLPPVPA
jgi:hypothetical protein